MSANEAFQTMLGWSEQELRDGDTTFPLQNEQETQRMVESVLLGVPWVDTETWLETRKGSRIERGQHDRFPDSGSAWGDRGCLLHHEKYHPKKAYGGAAAAHGKAVDRRSACCRKPPMKSGIL